MIKKEYIKPIPKYMIKLIKKIDKGFNYTTAILRFYSYYTKYKKELVKVTVAVKSRGKKWACKQVAIHGVHSNICLVKDMEFCYLGGYQVGFYEERLTRKKWYEDGKWYEADDKAYDPSSVCINKEYILTIPKYKYSQIMSIGSDYIIKYLRIYEQYPEVELMMKFGLSNYVFSKQIVNKLHKDKNFRTWILQHKEELDGTHYYVNTLHKAYKTDKPIKYIQRFDENKKSFYKPENYRRLKQEIETTEYERFFNYLAKHDVSCSTYEDYMLACKELSLDFKDTKHRYPTDFQRWHDIRIDEYQTKKALEDEKKRKKLYREFKNISKKYAFLERNLKDNYIVIIAKSPKDLIIEGNKLHHCVGSMNYDQKFVREESLIFFIRNKAEPNTPFVTMEYSPQNKRILQCYGYKDSRPTSDVLDFANNIWLPYANTKLKKMVA